MGVTSLELTNIYYYGRKYGGRLVSADLYLLKIEDQKRRNLKDICNLAGVKQTGRKYLKGCFALVIMNEMSVMREIAIKYEKKKGAYAVWQSKIRVDMDAKAKEKFALLDEGPAKIFIKTYLSSCLKEEHKDQALELEA